MDKASVFVGIDVAKHRLDAHLRPSGESFTINYGEEEVTVLVERLGALEPVLIVLEATGGLEVRLAAALAAGAPAQERPPQRAHGPRHRAACPAPAAARAGTPLPLPVHHRATHTDERCRLPQAAGGDRRGGRVPLPGPPAHAP